MQAKDAYQNGIEKFAGDKALYNAGVNSRETFLSNQSTYENNVLKFYQARYQLGKILRQADIDPKKIQKLTGKVTQLMRDMDEPDPELEKYVINSVISAVDFEDMELVFKPREDLPLRVC